jgi:O-antigen ligase
MGLLLCVRIAADGRRGRATRAAAAAGAPLLATGLYLSFSRGALLALFAGLVLLLILVPSPRAHARAALVLLGAGAVAALVSSLLPRVESLAPGQGAEAGQGLVMLAALVVLSLAAAVVTGRGAPPLSEPREGGLRLARPAAAAVLLLLVVGSLAAAALLESTPAAPTGSATSAKRFGSTDTARYAYWGVTLDAFADQPLRGLGSGGFAVAWRSEPGRSERAVDAHSLYLETLAELGLVGGVFLVLFLGGVVASAARLHARDPAAAAGPAAALLVYAVHAGLDWDWEMPALTGVALVLAACVVAWQDEPAA